MATWESTGTQTGAGETQPTEGVRHVFVDPCFPIVACLFSSAQTWEWQTNKHWLRTLSQQDQQINTDYKYLAHKTNKSRIAKIRPSLVVSRTQQKICIRKQAQEVFFLHHPCCSIIFFCCLLRKISSSACTCLERTWRKHARRVDKTTIMSQSNTDRLRTEKHWISDIWRLPGLIAMAKNDNSSWQSDEENSSVHRQSCSNEHWSSQPRRHSMTHSCAKWSDISVTIRAATVMYEYFWISYRVDFCANSNMAVQWLKYLCQNYASSCGLIETAEQKRHHTKAMKQGRKNITHRQPNSKKRSHAKPQPCREKVSGQNTKIYNRGRSFLCASTEKLTLYSKLSTISGSRAIPLGWELWR